MKFDSKACLGEPKDFLRVSSSEYLKISTCSCAKNSCYFILKNTR